MVVAEKVLCSGLAPPPGAERHILIVLATAHSPDLGEKATPSQNCYGSSPNSHIIPASQAGSKSTFVPSLTGIFPSVAKSWYRRLPPSSLFLLAQGENIQDPVVLLCALRCTF